MQVLADSARAPSPSCAGIRVAGAAGAEMARPERGAVKSSMNSI